MKTYGFISIMAHLFSHWTVNFKTKWQLYLVNFFQVIFDVMFCHLAGYDEINLKIKKSHVGRNIGRKRETVLL